MTSQGKTKLLFCTHARGEGKASCAGAGAKGLRKYAKQAIEPLIDAGIRVKVKKSDCLGYCKKGPAVMVLPDKLVYTCKTDADVDAILDAHLKKGPLAERLIIGKKKS